MSLIIETIKPAIGAIITGVDLNHLNKQHTTEIQQALLKHHVIFGIPMSLLVKLRH